MTVGELRAALAALDDDGTVLFAQCDHHPIYVTGVRRRASSPAVEFYTVGWTDDCSCEAE